MKETKTAHLRRIARLTADPTADPSPIGGVPASVHDGYGPILDPPLFGEAPPKAADPKRSLGTRREMSAARSQEAVVRAYSAMHGHPLEHDDKLADSRERRRWSVGIKSACAIVLLMLIVVAVRQCSVVRDDPRVRVSTTSQSDGVGASSADKATGLASGNGASPNEGQPSSTEAADGSQAIGNAQLKPLSATLGSPDAAAPDQTEAATSGVAVVHVAGQVKSPGVYELPSSARLIDAIKSAGGFLHTADSDRLNLAQLVQDGAQIYVPKVGEQIPSSTTATSAPGAAQDTQGKRVNINTGTVQELETLPGVGPKMAQRIIDWRTEHGAFTSVEELASVKGIGPAILGEISPLATL